MKTNNGDMPAMPVTGLMARGLTKREQFAMAAMQGLLSGGYCIDDARNRLNDVPSEAVKLADALLAELDKAGGE